MGKYPVETTSNSAQNFTSCLCLQHWQEHQRGFPHGCSSAPGDRVSGHRVKHARKCLSRSMSYDSVPVLSEITRQHQPNCSRNMNKGSVKPVSKNGKSPCEFESIYLNIHSFIIICINDKINTPRKTDSFGKNQELPIISLVPVPSCFICKEENNY